MTSRGYTLLEALLAIGLAGLIFTAAFGLFFTGQTSSAEALRAQRALWAAQEGLGAVESIAFSDLSPTQNGSVQFSAGQWTISGTGPESLSGELTRTIQVNQVLRDGACAIVGSGGNVDPDSYQVQSQVDWTDAKGRTHQVTLQRLRTNWQAPVGNCFVGGDCSRIDWNVSQATWYGGKQLREVYITNSSDQEFHLEKATLTWTNGAKVSQVFIGSDKFWSSSGPGTPSGTQVSGTLLDGQNLDIDEGETLEMHKIQFDSSMSGTQVEIVLQCEDGSSTDSGLFTPAL
ncbi:type II secretion system protein [Candidatus Uhrbacteria bacterium]|nr:type II secretion system protein [Candidatus Uhrbacteria bacterium]